MEEYKHEERDGCLGFLILVLFILLMNILFSERNSIQEKQEQGEEKTENPYSQ